MIGQYLLNKNKNAIVAKSEIFSELNASDTYDGANLDLDHEQEYTVHSIKYSSACDENSVL